MAKEMVTEYVGSFTEARMYFNEVFSLKIRQQLMLPICGIPVYPTHNFCFPGWKWIYYMLRQTIQICIFSYGF